MTPQDDDNSAGAQTPPSRRSGERRSGEHGHVPVMARRIIESLRPALSNPTVAQPVFVDATLGAGGHTELILREFGSVRVIGIDRDAAALDIAATRLADFGNRITFHQARFDELPAVLAEAGADRIDAALFDLGVSSMQLDQADRDSPTPSTHHWTCE